LAWARFSDQASGAAVEYPSGWQQSTTLADGHQQLTVYPPGADPTADVPGGAPFISFAWTSDFTAWQRGYSTITDSGTVTAGGVTGELYTIGGLGRDVVAAFPRPGGTSLLFADARDDRVMSVFEHMLGSLRFR
jgi:hypothetical protein